MTPASAPARLSKPRSSYLGITAKSLQKNGLSRRDRYAMQQAAGRLLFDTTAGKRQPHRVVHCNRSIKGDGVMVYRSASGSRFAGLTTCGSGWVCPVCAAKIAEKRREELTRAVVAHTKAGGMVYLMTGTFPHQWGDDLEMLNERLDLIRNRWRGSAAFKGLPKIGAVASLEVTHGENGWHPHVHLLVFVDRALTVPEKDKLVSMWAKQSIKAGVACDKLNELIEHGLDIRGGEDAAAYVTKYGREEEWGLSSELTRAHSKTAKAGNLKPFGLLALATNGDAEAGRLFTVFAEAFKGKRLLTWSPGLKKRFGIDEVEDEDLADSEEHEETQVAWLQPEQWRIVLSRDARAELLHFVHEYLDGVDNTQAEVDDFVQSLASRPRSSSGWHWQPMERRWLH